MSTTPQIAPKLPADLTSNLLADLTIQNAIAEGRLLLVRKAGEFWIPIKRAKAGRPKKKSGRSNRIFQSAVAELGINERNARHWQHVAKIPAPRFDAYLEHSWPIGGAMSMSWMTLETTNLELQSTDTFRNRLIFGIDSEISHGRITWQLPHLRQASKSAS